MRRFVLSLLIIVLLAAFLFPPQSAAAVVGVNSFAAQTAVGQTSGVDVGTAAVHSIQLVVTGGPVTCAYRLQGSNDGINWFDLSAADITCTSSIVSFESNKPARFVRGDLKTLTGGTSPTVTLNYAGR